MKTATEKRINAISQTLPAAVNCDLSDAMSNLLAVAEFITSKDERTGGEQYILDMVIAAAKKLPLYRDELNKYN